MVTLIIFLSFILIAFVFVVYKKFEIVFKIEIQNFDYNFEYNFLCRRSAKQGNVLELFKSGEGGIDIEFIKDVSEMVEVEELKTNVEIGSDFIFLTNIATVLVSTFIPMLYNFSVKSKKNLYYKVSPSYDRFRFNFFTDGKIKITYFELFLIYAKIKRIKRESVVKKQV